VLGREAPLRILINPSTSMQLLELQTPLTLGCSILGWLIMGWSDLLYVCLKFGQIKNVLKCFCKYAKIHFYMKIIAEILRFNLVKD